MQDILLRAVSRRAPRNAGGATPSVKKSSSISAPPKIAFWLPNFEMTGLQTSTIRVADALAYQGIHVDLVVCHNHGPSARLVKDPVRVVDLKRTTGHLGRGVLHALRYVLREQPHAICACSGSGYLLAALARLAGAKTQVWIWELSTREYRQLARIIETSGKGLSPGKIAWRSLVRRLYEIAQRVCMGSVAGIVANSRAVAHEVLEKGLVKREKLRVIYNACITDQMPGRHSRKRVRTRPIEDGGFIVSVGRLSVVKDLDVLLRAFRKLRDQRSVYLTIVGDGPCRQQLEKLIHELGLVDDCELSGFKVDPFDDLELADMFVLSSRTEPFGSVLVEAMAVGLPVVSTDCTGPREVLDWGRYGPLVPVGDHVALAGAMAQVLDSPPNRDVLRKRAMEFHVDRVATQYRDAFGI